jgi:hypothetical protein
MAGSVAPAPVDLSTGLFVYRKTDLAVADVMPSRHYTHVRLKADTARTSG